MYHIGQLSTALEHMNAVSIDKESDPYNYYVNETNKGLCLYSLKKYSQSIKVLENILEYKSKKVQIKAYIHLAQNYLYYKLDNSDNNFLKYIKEAISIINKQIDEKQDIELCKSFLAHAYYLKAMFYSGKDQNQNVEENLKNILSLNIDEYQASTILELANINLATNNEIKYIFDLIKVHSVELDFFNALKFSITDVYIYTYQLLRIDEKLLLNDFLNYCYNTYTEHFHSKCDILSATSSHFFNQGEYGIANRILNYSLTF